MSINLIKRNEQKLPGLMEDLGVFDGDALEKIVISFRNKGESAAGAAFSMNSEGGGVVVLNLDSKRLDQDIKPYDDIFEMEFSGDSNDADFLFKGQEEASAKTAVLTYINREIEYLINSSFVRDASRDYDFDLTYDELADHIYDEDEIKIMSRNQWRDLLVNTVEIS